MQSRFSKLDGKTLIVEIEHGDSGELVDLLDSRGHGFAVFGNVEFPFAVIDGRLRSESWCTESHMLAIEAHELGHIRMNSNEEVVAEKEGIRLLEKAGHTAAASLLYDRGIV